LNNSLPLSQRRKRPISRGGHFSLLLVALLLWSTSLPAQLSHLSHLSLPVGGGALRGFVPIDLDGDGDLDLATVDGDGVITLLWNSGNGFVGNRQILLPGNGIDGLVRGLTSGDLDGDGDDDLAFYWAPVNGTGGFVSIRRNLAPGIFASRQDVPLDLQEVFTPLQVEIIDIDSDGVQDIVAATNQYAILDDPASITILLGQGVGGNGEPIFGNPQHRFSLFYTENLRVADYDADGDLDIALSHELGEEISFFFNNGSGAFSPATTIFLGGGASGPRSMTADDLDQNGTIDLLISNVYSKTFTFLEGNGDGTFNDTGSFVTGLVGYGVQGRHSVGDLDGDGDLDLVVPYTSGLMKIHYNDGSADFSDQSIHANDPNTRRSVIIDLDGDTTLDIVMDLPSARYINIRTALPASTVHVEPKTVARGGLLELPILVGANLDIEAFSFGVFLDDSLLAPLSLLPGFHLEAYTNGIGPEFWQPDLAVPGGGMTVDCVISSTPGGAVLPAGALLQAAEALLGVSNVLVPTLTPVFPTSGLGMPAVTTLEGQTVEPSLSGTLIEIIVPLQFVRGDVNENGLVNIADPALLLRRLFLNATPGTCPASEDVNNNGIVSISDAIHLLVWLFASGAPPDSPFPTCGIAPDPVNEECEAFGVCP